MRQAAQGRRVVDIELTRGFPAQPRRHWRPGAVKTLVTIMQGCDNFCTFCVVPYVRGREYSRPSGEIVAEVADFLAAGGKEVTLLGQNVNSYGRGLPEGVTFSELLRRIDALDGLARLRFATSHPRDLSPELTAAFGKLPSLCEHQHLPVQSGSDRILKAMNRGYTRREYLQKVAELRRVCPGICLSTDIIVGFPGETEADFEQTLELVEEAGFDQAFSFKYSPRPQTRAAALPDRVPGEVQAERLTRLQNLLNELTLKAHQRLIGKIAEVLVDGISKRSREELCGRLRTNQVVNFSGPRDSLGRLVMVKLTEAHPHSLKGTRVEDSSLSGIMLRQMTVSGLTIDPFTNSPIMILKDVDSDKAVPIWIGLLEATAIASELENIKFSRPMTHDLLKIIMETMAIQVTRVEVCDLRDNTYFALIHLNREGQEVTIDARPSDAIALALRVKAPIYVAEVVIQKARRVDLSAKEAITTEDAKKWTEILEGLDPDDFGKYKM
ncbi:MAG: tRNA (N6-isopentenyl adenosine(37)-C2)-methylthiotransferase MiaB [Deltaproteobacteria bacterium]|nr:tRNA (N6-isopentenyl adenosine(37)-C2)-methylthiotransferase MiaB [Deltaproteobacteria bacterium]